MGLLCLPFFGSSKTVSVKALEAFLIENRLLSKNQRLSREWAEPIDEVGLFHHIHSALSGALNAEKVREKILEQARIHRGEPFAAKLLARIEQTRACAQKIDFRKLKAAVDATEFAIQPGDPLLYAALLDRLVLLKAIDKPRKDPDRHLTHSETADDLTALIGIKHGPKVAKLVREHCFDRALNQRVPLYGIKDANMWGETDRLKHVDKVADVIKSNIDVGCTEAERALNLAKKEGAAYMKEGQYQNAISIYTNAINELNPKDPLCFLCRGNCHLAIADYSAAFADHRSGTGLNRNDAMAFFDHAIELSQDVAWHLCNRGYASLVKEVREPALSEFNNALEVNAQHVRGFFKNAVKVNPNDTWVLCTLANAELVLGHDTQAFDYLNSAFRLNEQSAERFVLEDFKLNPRRGMLWCGKLIERNPADYRPFITRGDCKLGLDDCLGAIGDYIEGTKLDPSMVVALFEQAPKEDPGDAKTLLIRGYAYSLLGQDDHAHVDFEGAIKLCPEFARDFRKKLCELDPDRALKFPDERASWNSPKLVRRRPRLTGVQGRQETL